MFEIVCNPMESRLKLFVIRRCLKIIENNWRPPGWYCCGGNDYDKWAGGGEKSFVFLLFSILCFEEKLTHLILSVFLWKTTKGNWFCGALLWPIWHLYHHQVNASINDEQVLSSLVLGFNSGRMLFSLINVDKDYTYHGLLVLIVLQWYSWWCKYEYRTSNPSILILILTARKPVREQSLFKFMQVLLSINSNSWINRVIFHVPSLTFIVIITKLRTVPSKRCPL